MEVKDLLLGCLLINSMNSELRQDGLARVISLTFPLFKQDSRRRITREELRFKPISINIDV
jgi:hypothetical protein